MKRILKSFIVLLLFSLSLILFQLSCDEEVDAQHKDYILPPATASTLGGVKVGEGLSVTIDGILSLTEGHNNGQESLDRFLYVFYNDNTNTTEFWTAKHDGTDNKQIPISLPSGLKISSQSGVLTPNGQTLIFTVRDLSNVKYIYSISIDGSNLKKLIDGTGKTGDGIVYDVLQTY
jgi:hypothetical protein